MFLLIFGIAMVAIGVGAMVLSAIFAALDICWNAGAIIFKIGVVLVAAPFVIGLFIFSITLILALLGLVALF